MTHSTTNSPDTNPVDLDRVALSLPDDAEAPTFASLGLPVVIVEDLAARGITIPTPVQVESVPLVLRNQNLIVRAKTGTGKTFAFGLPLLTKLAEQRDQAQLPTGNLPAALIVAPTRELALQVGTDLERAGRALGLRVTTVYGGQDFAPQIAALTDGVDVVVGTPGRLLDLTRQKHLRLDQVRIAVLDEADEMLDMGFLPDVRSLLAACTSRSQLLLFSATMPAPVLTLARSFMTNPMFLQVDSEDATATVRGVTQHVFATHNLDKPEVLARVLQSQGCGPSIVFCRTKMGAERVANELIERGFNAASLHGDLSQNAREKALTEFRSGAVQILVATDVAARGIDVSGVTHVINYNCPEDAATYLHRIGRTARAGSSGTAVTFVDWDMVTRWTLISRELELGFDQPVETFSTSPHLYDALAIPAEASGSIGAPVRTPKPRRSTDRPQTSGRGDRPGGGGRDRRGGRERTRTTGDERDTTSRDRSPSTPATAPRERQVTRTADGTRRRQRARRGTNPS